MQSKNAISSIFVAVVVLITIGLVAAGNWAITVSDQERSSRELQTTNAIVRAHPELQCSKCGGTMERGFVIDHTAAVTQVETWIPGEPQSDSLGEIKHEHTETVVSFRCSKCGYLESYTK